jgi:hypothetical protein
MSQLPYNHLKEVSWKIYRTIAMAQAEIDELYEREDLAPAKSIAEESDRKTVAILRKLLEGHDACKASVPSYTRPEAIHPSSPEMIQLSQFSQDILGGRG